MVILIEVAQKDFRAQLSFQYNGSINPKNEYMLKVTQGKKIEVQAGFGLDFHGALRRTKLWLDGAVGPTLSSALTDNVLREFNIAPEHLMGMHLANLTAEEKLLIEQNEEFEQWAAQEC